MSAGFECLVERFGWSWDCFLDGGDCKEAQRELGKRDWLRDAAM